MAGPLTDSRPQQLSHFQPFSPVNQLVRQVCTPKGPENWLNPLPPKPSNGPVNQPVQTNVFCSGEPRVIDMNLWETRVQWVKKLEPCVY